MGRKLNILYCLTKLELGGAQLQLLDLIRGLDREKFQPFLFTAQGGLLMADALSIEGLAVKKSIFLERAINPLKDFLALAEIFYFIRRNRIALVHTHSSKAGILARFASRLAGVKTVLHTVHGWPFHDYQPRWVRAFYILLERLAAACCAKLIVACAYDRQKGLCCGIGRPGQYQVIPHGINAQEFPYDVRQIRDGLGIREAEAVVGNISCFKPQKGLGDYLRACASVKQEFPRTKFILCGDGKLRRWLQATAGRLGLGENFIFLGWRRDIPQVLAAMDIFALTSLWEGLPVSVLEALSAGKPVVATNTGAVAEVIQDGNNGFLVPCADAAAAAEKIALLIKDRLLRNRMSEAARESVQENFSRERMPRETQGLYAQLTGERGAGWCMKT
jgi:glycosyltransferase involved in cell wall biosynthesis